MLQLRRRCSCSRGEGSSRLLRGAEQDMASPPAGLASCGVRLWGGVTQEHRGCCGEEREMHYIGMHMLFGHPLVVAFCCFTVPFVWVFREVRLQRCGKSRQYLRHFSRPGNKIRGGDGTVMKWGREGEGAGSCSIHIFMVRVVDCDELAAYKQQGVAT